MLHNQDYHNILLSLFSNLKRVVTAFNISQNVSKGLSFNFILSALMLNIEDDVFLTNDISRFLLAFSTN